MFRFAIRDILWLTAVVGLALETTIRILSRLTKKGLLAKSGRNLVIRDLHRSPTGEYSGRAGGRQKPDGFIEFLAGIERLGRRRREAR